MNATSVHIPLAFGWLLVSTWVGLSVLGPVSSDDDILWNKKSANRISDNISSELFIAVFYCIVSREM